MKPEDTKNPKSVKQVMIEHEGRTFGKGEHYLVVYERYFRKFVNKPVNMLEIGVRDGGSLEVWKKYFGDQANIFGLDITPECKKFEEDRVKIFIGDQADKTFMNSIADEMPKLNIVLDDGGHTMEQQINSFEVLYPKLAYGGVYICEDCGTSYLSDYGGGFKREGTFIEYMKAMTDKLNLTLLGDVENNPIGTSTFGIHFYNSMVVLEKRRIKKHREVAGGKNQRLKETLAGKPKFWV